MFQSPSQIEDVFCIDNTDIGTAKRERIDKQNYVDTVATKKDVEDLIGKAGSFNAKIFDLFERMTNDKIKKFREKLKAIVE